VVYFDFSAIEALSKKPLIMHVVYSWIYHRAKKDPRKILLYIDEAHYYFKFKALRDLLEKMIRHSRHYKLGVTLITQGLNEFLAYDETRNILANTHTRLIFRLEEISDEAREILRLSEGDIELIKTARQGKESGFSTCLFTAPGYGNFELLVLASDGEKEAFGKLGRGV